LPNGPKPTVISWPAPIVVVGGHDDADRAVRGKPIDEVGQRQVMFDLGVTLAGAQ
jgi:hypothetical protein